MTRIAVVSDIHGNMHGLELALQDAEKRNVDKIICLGDTVSKYFYPKESWDEINKVSDFIIKGNVEHYVINAPDDFKSLRDELGKERYDRFENLPNQEQLLIGGSLIDFFHASPHNIEELFNPFIPYEFQNKRYKDLGLVIENPNRLFVNSNNIKNLTGNKISFCGHIHQGYIALINGLDIKTITDSQFIIKPGTDVIINVGSIGDPSRAYLKDDNSFGFAMETYLSYAIIDGDLNSDKITDIKVEMIKVPYHETMKKIYFDMQRMHDTGEINLLPSTKARFEDALSEKML